MKRGEYNDILQYRCFLSTGAICRKVIILPVLVKGMEFNKEDILEWESGLMEQNFIRMYGIKDYSAYLKKRHSKRRVNKNLPTFWWVKESKRARVKYQRAFRRNQKQNINMESTCHIRACEYKTYGYLTW